MPSRSPRLLVLGTRNRKKREELQRLFGPLGLELATLDKFDSSVDVVEDGDSFAANAALKATQQAIALRQWVLGEDSGLVVPALDGAPGIYSARYAGPDATDEENNDRLLEALADRDASGRAAFYVCHMTLADPAGNVRAESEGECHGRIRSARAGSGGFGYDPLFELAEYHRTFGEVGAALKQALSHRGRAARQLLPQLARLIAGGAWEEAVAAG